MPRDPVHRLSYLDGLRGLAILLVLLFHAYARWPDHVPFGGDFADVFVFKTGFIGVNLFFLISGFVILMTLEKCTSFGIFFMRRWLRLFPAMLVCSAIIFATAPLFPERPAGLPMPRDLLPGLTFIDPAIWQKVIGGTQGSLEGAFWSLYVEMKFYVVFGALYFSIGRLWAIWALSAIFFLSLVIPTFATLAPYLSFAARPAAQLLGLLGAEYYGWFAGGAMFYRYASGGKLSWLIGGLGISLVSAGVMIEPSSKIAAIAVIALFAGSLVSRTVQLLLSAKWLLFVGFISYPLYLLHENLLVAGMIKLAVAAPGLPSLLYPVLPALGLIGLAWIVASYLEPRVKHALQEGLNRLQRRKRLAH
jgi:peptidoglycan/LPS O-acetylase OafA/YrhL